MNILIIGCGKVGSSLANALDKRGHVVAVVDSHGENFDRLDEGFTGYTVEGVPIDLEILGQAGIEACDFLIAACDDDNINIMVSQIARELFGVPKVLTRIFDPRRTNVFAQFGLSTICPTSLTVDAIEKIIQGEESEASFFAGGSRISISQLAAPDGCQGLTLEEMDHDPAEMAVGVIREDGTVLLRDAAPGYQLQAGDRLLVIRTI